MPANYLNAFRGPNLAEVDRAAYSNKLLSNEADRIPQMNQAQDLALQRERQDLEFGQQRIGANQNASRAEYVSRGFAAIANSQKASGTARAVLADQRFMAEAKALGIPVEQFSVTDQDTDDQIRQLAAGWAQAVTGQLQQQQRPWRVEEGPDGEKIAYGPNDEPRTLLGRRPQEPRPASGPDAPSGYRFTQSGALEPIPGGPADITGPRGRREAMSLRKEFEGTDVVSNYRNVLPLYERASTAPDNRAGDISVIYALGKMFDPTSVVREGELQLSMDAAPWLQKAAASINSQITGEGRLTPAMRADIMQALQGQVDAMRAPYEQERQRFSQYASESGFEPGTVVGSDPAEAFSTPRPQAGGNVAPEGTVIESADGRRMVKRNGRWEPQ